MTLVPLEDADVAKVHALLAHPDNARWWPSGSIDELRHELFDDAFPMAIVADDALVGVIMYSEVVASDYMSVGVDITLAASVHGQGLGPEALLVLIRWLIEVGAHHRVTIDPAADNARAIRAYEKVGFRPVGIMREYERGADGTWHDNLLMDLLAREVNPNGRDVDETDPTP